MLRGPQGTLYGRNATAGVVNLVTAKPTDQFEALASGELGNYHQRRFEGMLNLPIVDDRVDLRIAGEWTKRQGYSFNSRTDKPHGRSRSLVGTSNPRLQAHRSKLQTYLIWEHFSEDDDRMRTAKQLCKTATDSVHCRWSSGTAAMGFTPPGGTFSGALTTLAKDAGNVALFARCFPSAKWIHAWVLFRQHDSPAPPIRAFFDPYASTTAVTKFACNRVQL